MWRRYPVSLALVLILSLLVQPFPATPVRAQEITAPEQTSEPLPDPEPPPDTPLLVEPWTDPHLPSLMVQLAVEPQDWVRVGDMIPSNPTISIMKKKSQTKAQTQRNCISINISTHIIVGINGMVWLIAHSPNFVAMTP